MRNHHCRSLLAALVLGSLTISGSSPAARSAPAQAEEPSATAFLAQVRQAFDDRVWGRLSGRVQHRSPRARINTDIALSLQIEAPQLIRARLVLHGDRVYEYRRQTANSEAGSACATPRVEFREPTGEAEVTLEELGLRMEDLVFDFLYWTMIEETAAEAVRGRPCRVFLLEDPKSGRRLRAWFAREHLAPLRIVWLEPDGESEERLLEMTDFESRRGVWYVKSFILTGDDWQTRVRFFEGSLTAHRHRPPPDNLFEQP